MPSQPTAASASTQALLLPDVLFELILHLDFHALLCCQCVCRTWKSVIDRSHEARQTLFLDTDDRRFEDFKAAEEYDIAIASDPAFQHPQQRIPLRPEFRALFNPWVFTHGCEPIATWGCSPAMRKIAPAWRFTDRVSSGRLDFCLMPFELINVVDQMEASWNKMFLTQPPVKRVLVNVQGGYMSAEDFDIEKEEGVRIGDIMGKVRGTNAVKVMRGRKGDKDFTTLELKFDEHFAGKKFWPLQRLEMDRLGNVDVKVF